MQNNNIKSVKQKRYITPNTIEWIDFRFPIDKQNPVIKNPNGRNGSLKNETEQQKTTRKKDNRLKTLQRAKAKLWRLYQCNRNQWQELDKFLTLTFRQNITDISISDNEFKKFMKRLRYFTRDDIQFLGVREQQERGAIHYHVILFNCPFVHHSILLELWNENNEYMQKTEHEKMLELLDPFEMTEGLSGVNIRGIKEASEELQNYINDYALKDIIDNGDWLQGRKTILQSRKLFKPKITEYENIEYIPGEQTKKGITFLDSMVSYYREK